MWAYDTSYRQKTQFWQDSKCKNISEIYINYVYVTFYSFLLAVLQFDRVDRGTYCMWQSHQK